MAAKPTERGPQTISIQQAASLLGRSTQWVHKLVADGHIQKEARGQYTVFAVVRGALSHYEDLLQKQQRTAAASRVTDARTREIELRIAERKRDLIPQEDAKAVVGEMAAMVRAEFIGLPARVTRDLELRRTLEQEVDASFVRLATAAERARAALANGGIDMEAEPEA